MKKIAIAIFVCLCFIHCSKTSSTLSGLASLPSDDNNKPVGSSAHDLLASSSHGKLVVEIQYMPGMQLQAQTVANLSSFLGTYLNKPAGIDITQQQVPSAGKATMNLSDIALSESQNRTGFNSGSQMVVYVLVTDAAYETANVLGIAYRNTSIGLLGKTIQSNSGGIGQASRVKLETTVLEHEFGHLLGLVDNGSAMQVNHKDAANGAHCNNSNCLMYYQVESTDFLGFLVTGNIPVLDANCVNDLKANGSK